MLNALTYEANRTYTENGAAAYFSTESSCLDLFADAGALRSATDEDILKRFIRAYAENMFNKKYHADIRLESVRIIGNPAEISTEKSTYAVYTANNAREQTYNEKNHFVAFHFFRMKFPDKHFHANQNDDKAEYCFYQPGFRILKEYHSRNTANKDQRRNWQTGTPAYMLTLLDNVNYV